MADFSTTGIIVLSYVLLPLVAYLVYWIAKRVRRGGAGDTEQSDLET